VVIFDFSSACEEINSSNKLLKVLEQVNLPVKEICQRLELPDKTCTDLANAKSSLKTVAKGYINQKRKACWEDIITHLCRNFDYKKLAKEVAEKHGLDVSLYCE